MINEKASKLAFILSKIPIHVWGKIIEKEPEWQMKELIDRFGFGKFAVVMVAAGLNDFQLKGKAEVAYWPRLRKILEKTPRDLKELENTLAGFYSNERLPTLKLKRLKRFLSSNLATRLWKSDPEEVAGNFISIWYELAATMKQSRNAKTIAFAMKCLGIALLMAGVSDFDFEKIPIPVDYRVKTFTERIGVRVESDDDVRTFWNEVLDDLRKHIPVNMIHLDSLIWQIGTLSKTEIVDYFVKLGLGSVGEELAEVVEK